MVTSDPQRRKEMTLKGATIWDGGTPSGMAACLLPSHLPPPRPGALQL